MKKLLSFLLAALLLLSLGVSAFAEDWLVTFTADAKMVSNFSQGSATYDGALDLKNEAGGSIANFNDFYNGMQPGDQKTFSLRIQNNHAETTDWYMKNTVLKSLEDNLAHGGAYTYYLTYVGPDEKAAGTALVLHDSTTVGGGEFSYSSFSADREGLLAATTALKDYFYLDTLKNGESGNVYLTISLDGETQGNSYQDTAANLDMQFAVELKAKSNSNRPDVVKTGDDTNLLPAYIAMIVSGLLFLYLAIDSVKQRRKEARG